MFFISHRGNTSGPNPRDENKIEYIEETLKNFDVEIDVWYHKNDYYLGHDEPSYKVNNQSKIRNFGYIAKIQNVSKRFQSLMLISFGMKKIKL